MTRSQELAERYREYVDADALGFTDEDWDAADKIDLALEATGDLTPSAAARKAGISNHRALTILRYLVANQWAYTTGNGCWTHFHPGRAGQ